VFDFRKIPLFPASMIVVVAVRVRVVMLIREVDIKLHAGDARLLPARNVEMVAVQLEFLQLAFEPAGVHAEVEQRGDEHVAGDAAEEVEIKRLHEKIILATD
jgi:hypothetical protein